MKNNNFKIKRYISLLIIFLLSFSFFYFLTSNLPFSLYDSADLFWINLANNESWSATFINFITKDDHPLPHSGTALTRPGQLLFTKLILYFFGFNAFYFYLSRAIIFALACVVIFLIAEKSIHHKSLSFLIVFFYMTLPPIFSASMWLADIAILAQLFLLISILFYLKLFFSKKVSFKSSFFLQFSVLFFFFLSLRTKENAVVLVPILTLFTLVYNWQKLKQYKFLFFFLFFIAFYFILYNSEGNLISNIYPIIFKNNLYSTSGINIFDIEENTALFSPMTPIKMMPGSLINLLGFFLSWITIFLFVYIAVVEKWFSNIFNKLIKFITYYPTEVKFSSISNVYLTFFGIWFISEVSLFFWISPEARFLINGGALPLIFLVFLMIDKFLLLLKGHLKKIIFVFILIIILVYLVINTYNTSIHIVGRVSALTTILDKAVNIMLDYEINDNRFSNPQLIALSQAYGLLPNEIKVEDILLSNKISFWKINSAVSTNIKRILLNHPQVYIISSEQIDFRDKYTIIETIILQPCPKGVYCKFKQKLDEVLGENTIQPYFLYILKKI